MVVGTSDELLALMELVQKSQIYQVTIELSCKWAKALVDKLIAEILVTVVIRSVIDALTVATPLLTQDLQQAIYLFSATVESENQSCRFLLIETGDGPPSSPRIYDGNVDSPSLLVWRVILDVCLDRNWLLLEAISATCVA